MITLADFPLYTDSLELTGTVAEHRFVTLAGVYPAAGGQAYGVTRDGGDSGDVTDVKVLGKLLVESGGAVSKGARVVSDSTGRAVAMTAAQAVAGTVTVAIAGGSAGNLTVTGIATTDSLISVVRLDRDATAANVNLSVITSEFTITATNTINNAGGTDTTGDTLLITYRDASAVIYPQGVAVSDVTTSGQPLLILRAEV